MLLVASPKQQQKKGSALCSQPTFCKWCALFLCTRSWVYACTVACICFWRQRVHFFPNTPVSLLSRTRSDQVLEAKLMQRETEQFDFVFYLSLHRDRGDSWTDGPRAGRTRAQMSVAVMKTCAEKKVHSFNISFAIVVSSCAGCRTDWDWERCNESVEWETENDSRLKKNGGRQWKEGVKQQGLHAGCLLDKLVSTNLL